MRRFLACLVVAVAVPASAGATSLPPLNGIRATVRYVPAMSQHRGSCSEQGRSRRVSRLTRKLAPVACEQPPRPKVQDTTPGLFLRP